MKNKKVISIILSLSAMFSAFGAVPASAESNFSIATGYEFVDIAHKGNTYVAMAKKSETNNGAKLYYSNDGGLNWQASTTSITNNSHIAANPQSQQQLVYWEDNGTFVVKTDSATYTSSDGNTWASGKIADKNGFHWSGAAMLAVSGDTLILGANQKARAVDKNYNGTIHPINTNSSYYVKTIAAKPTDENGDITVFVAGCNMGYDLKYNKSNDTWSQEGYNSVSALPMYPYDMIYAANAGQFLSVDSTNGLIAFKDSKNFVKVTVDSESNATVTGVNANDKYIIAGMSDGKIYYTANAEITAETSWTEIPYAGTTAPSNSIKNIEFADDGNSFVALSNTQIYKGNLSKFINIDEYVEEYRNVADPIIKGEAAANPFEGIRLIGGTYSDTLGKYVVYGDTVSKISVEGGVAKYWGMIYTSTDGINWEQVYQGYTFSKHNDNGSFAEVRNGAVWWGAQNQFIISASTQDHSGVSLVSADGTKGTWSAASTDDTDFRLNTDIAIGGNNLYTTNNGRQFRTYTAWNKTNMTYIGVTKTGTGAVPDTWYMNQIAVSDDSTNPAVLMAQNGNGVVRNNESTATEESDKWTLIDALGGAGALTDAVYSDKLGKFVAVLTTGNRTSIVSKDGSVVQGPVVTGSGVCNAIDTNGEVFMFAGKDGNVYTAPDTADFSKENTTLTAVPSANGNKNEMNVTNVFKAGNKFIATASDNENSDVLLISKNSNGIYEYVTASSFLSDGELVPGGSVEVSVNVENQMAESCGFTIIAAIFNSEGKLVQVKTEDKAVESFTNTTETMTVDVKSDIPTGSSMRAFVWDSTDGMVPITKVSNPFN